MVSWLSLAVILAVLIAGFGIGFIVAGMLAAGRIEDLCVDCVRLQRELDDMTADWLDASRRLSVLTDRDERGRFVRREPGSAI